MTRPQSVKKKIHQSANDLDHIFFSYQIPAFLQFLFEYKILS